MKARLLIKLLNDTKYYPNNNEEYIAVGSPLCHKLFSVDKKTLEIKYALDTFREGRKALEGKDNTELLFIWDKLHELVASGQMKEIIEGNDAIPEDKRLPVFTVRNGKLIETYTDKYGWPNTTYDGDTMFDNTYFKDREKAIRYGIKENEAHLKWAVERKEEQEKKVKATYAEIDEATKNIDNLKLLLDAKS